MFSALCLRTGLPSTAPSVTSDSFAAETFAAASTHSGSWQVSQIEIDWLGESKHKTEMWVCFGVCFVIRIRGLGPRFL